MSAPATVSHWRDLPLSPGGRALVEASAGTGKTWTIGVLYLRVLLESSPALGVGQVVVTTFTDAAAQELRERLRARLLQALAWFEAPPAAAGGTDAGASLAPAADETWLRARWADPAVREDDRRRLRLALADFDRAPVGTLHRLCRRILAEHPLEGGTGFDPGEPTAGEALAEELARDAWRVLHQGDDAGMLARAGLAELKLSTFTKTLGRLLRPGVRIDADGPDEAALRAALPAGFAAALRGAVAAARFQPRKTALANALKALADWADGDDDALGDAARKNLQAFDLDAQLVPEAIAAFVADPAIVAARTLAGRLEAARHLPALRFWRDQVERVARWRDERLAARGQTTFDEMIRRAHDAMQARPALADALFADWPVALVDEFQDTDALQYGILDRLYRDAHGAPRGRLVMIGDPKQAIYGFRGGDIHAYRRARADAGHVLALDTNHRSSRAYVAGVNALYAAAGERLGRGEGSDLRYVPVRASARQDGSPYTVDGAVVDAPLVLHHLADDPGGQDARRRAALRACADQVAALLASGRHAIAGRALEPGQLAVLLPTNRDITTLRGLLQSRGVPCVGGARDSVFAGDWAFELQVVLQALLADDDEGALRAAMLTRLWGGDLAAVAALDADAAAWDAAAARRRRLQALWRRQGVLAVALALAGEAAPRLLATPAGERDLTDLRHLGELLQQQAGELAGPRELLAWLADQRAGEPEDDASDDRQLRIESDARRVQLMTLHKAKGLEFPVVFLPLMWAQEGKPPERPALVPVDGEAGRLAACDAEALRRAAWEGQDERFRTLYVALTRAIHACHVYTLPPGRAPNSRQRTAKADPERSPLDAMVEALLAADPRALPHVDWRTGWPAEAGLRPVAPAAAPPPRVVQPMPPPAPPRQRLSFSAVLGHVRAGVEESPADDEAPGIGMQERETPVAELPHPDLLALAGVRGTAFGNAVHALFEHRDAARPLAAQVPDVVRALDDFGVRADLPLATLAPVLAARLDGALRAELRPGLRLAEVPATAQRAEMAFHFALDGARASALRAACAAHGEPGLVPPLSLERLRGLMTGKIDLVFEHAGAFHVLDYKGNWLGGTLADYAGDALRAAMDHSHYRLQALLYTVALHRLLSARLPGYAPARHLGGYIYLYVRAAGLAPGAGVFSDRFDETLLRAVDAALATPEADAA